jgi:hypothetical protein
MRGGFLGVVGAACALAACTTPVTTKSDYPMALASHTEGVPPLQGCKLAITEISDLRSDPTTIGLMGGRVVYGPAEPRAWIEKVLAGLKAYGADVTFPPPGSTRPTDLVATASLVTAWVSGMATAKTSSVVVRIRYDKDGAMLKEASYRGAESEVNWFNSSDEIQAMIDAALTQILEAMSRDLVSLCPASTS